MDPVDFALLQLVARAGLILGDQVANRAFRENPEAFIRRPAEARLKRLAVQGYLETRPVVFAASDSSLGNEKEALLRVGKVTFAKGYLVTQKASDELNLALPETPREPLIAHHVKTLDALERLEHQHRAKGDTIVEFKTEAQLIREEFKGRVFGGPGQQIVPKFPDAILIVRHPDGTNETVNVEYVSSKYTDQMIREKAAAFRGPVAWAVSNSETAARVQAITGEEPMIV
jgi:hypothetical protein